MTNKYQKKSVSNITNEHKKVDLFLTCASYEDRCLSIPSKLRGKIKKSIIFYYENYIEHSSKNLKELSTLLSGSKKYGLNALTPSLTAQCILDSFKSLNKPSNNNIVIDITTFTHESVLILIKIVTLFLEKNNKITLVYNSAKNYSVGDRENIWLSRGLKEVRSIIGYGGLLKPNKKNHFIILVGFESDRALKLIAELEPDLISIGHGEKETTTSKKHYESNKKYHSLVNSYAVKKVEANQFSFDCSNPLNTMNTINQIVQDSSSEYNTIISPMNTKLSTIGVGLHCFKNPNTQLSYSLPLTYNFDNYSEPSEWYYSISFNELMNQIEF